MVAIAIIAFGIVAGLIALAVLAAVAVGNGDDEPGCGPWS